MAGEGQRDGIEGAASGNASVCLDGRATACESVPAGSTSTYSVACTLQTRRYPVPDISLKRDLARRFFAFRTSRAETLRTKEREYLENA